MKIHLNYPVFKKGFLGIGDISITEITLRRPCVKDMIGLDFTTPTKQVESMRFIISRISGLPIETLDQIDMSDWITIAEAFTKLTTVKING